MYLWIPGCGQSVRIGSVFASFGEHRSARLGRWVLLGLLAVGTGADCIASDKPLMLFFQGELYLLPNLTEPAALRPYDISGLLQVMTPQDWALLPPVPHGSNHHDLAAVLKPPGAGHPLGTDSSGRDVLARLVHGAQVSLVVAAVAVTLLLGLGLLVGGVAGYCGGWVDALLMRLLEVVHVLPLFLVVSWFVQRPAPSAWAAPFYLGGVIGVLGWSNVARLMRGEVLRLRALPFVEAAAALGCSPLRIFWHHILPNGLGPLWVAGIVAVPAAVFLESALSFLGLGFSPDRASWGALLDEGRRHPQAWWLIAYPGLALLLVALACQLVGEGLRTQSDPRRRRPRQGPLNRP